MTRPETESAGKMRRFFRPRRAGNVVQELEAFRGSWYAYAEGYRQAADTVARKAMRTRPPTFVVFPVVYLYRHYVELTLKSLIVDLDRLHGEDEPAPVGHDLGRLWNEFRTRVMYVYRSASPPELVVIEQAVREFMELDSGAQHFRYPTGREGVPLRHLLPAIDLERLCEEMETLSRAFQQVEAAIGEWLDDMAREFRAWELFERDFT